MTARPQAPSRGHIEKVIEFILANEPMFKIEETEVLGVKQRAYVNAPPDLRFLFMAAQEHLDNEAVVLGDVRWTYRELIGKSLAVANGLREKHGIRQGDRVALALRNSPEWMAAFFGVIAAGGVAVPLNGWWTSEEMGFGLSDSGAKLVIAGERQAGRIRPLKDELGLTLVGARAEMDDVDDTLQGVMAAGAGKPAPELQIAPDDDFAIFYTSGSTGSPKGAVLTHRGAVTTCLSYALIGAGVREARGGEDMFENPAVLVAVPLFHCTGSHAVCMMSFISGRKMVLMRKWDSGDAVDLIQREKITNFVGVPTMSHEITLEAERRGVSLDMLKDISAGGAKRPPAHVKRLDETFPQAWSSTGYGLTETNALGTYNSLHDYQAKPGSCGPATPAVTDVKVVREDGSDANPGESGEVWLRGPCVFRGYLNQAEATAAVLTEDRWFKSGDLGYLDEDGFLFIVDRIKDIILRGGENISCLEVEHALSHHPDIIEAAVIGIPDERLGESVGAAVVLRPEASLTDEAITEFLAPHLAPFKRPERYWRIDGNLPRGGTGKIDKPGLRKTLLSQLEDAS